MHARSLLWIGMAMAAPLAAQPAPRAPDPAPAPADDMVEAPEIVVTGSRPPGSVVGTATPEISLSPADIRSYGVSSITDLMAELAPLTGAGADATPPVILLGGRRIASFSEIRSIPAEAIRRVEILPEEVALRYGYRAEQKVVNIVLRQRFRSVTAEFGAAMPTAGGQSTLTGAGTLLHLSRTGRLNIELKASGSSALWESERNVTPRPPRRPYALAGNVMAASPGAEIDPALSVLAGQTVTVAGVPASAAAGPADLAAFAALAGTPNQTDVRPYRTLLPESRSLDLNAVYSRMLGTVSATVNAQVQVESSDAANGLAASGFLLPAGSPWSPFGSYVNIYRYISESNILSRTSDTTSTHLGVNLGSDTGGWRWSATASYDRAETSQHNITGIDATAAQEAVAAGLLNPFGDLAASGYADIRTVDRSHSVSNSADAQLVASGAAVRLPSGDAMLSLTAGAATLGLDSWSLRDGVFTASSLSRGTLSGQISLDLPLSSRRGRILPLPGDFSLNLNLGYDRLSDAGTLRKAGYGLIWSPWRPLRIEASVDHSEAAPTPDQLGAAPYATAGVRIFDYVRGETAEVTRIGGGNPLLRASDSRLVKLGLNWKPLADDSLTLSASYRDRRTDRPTLALPAPTAALEAIFPDRFVRDAAGTLTLVDSRPVNFASREQRNLRWGLNVSRRIGAAPARRAGDDAVGSVRDPRLRRRGRGAGGARGTRVQFALYDSWYFTDRVLVRSGGPTLDLLGGDTLGGGGGLPRHRIDLRAGITHNGLGARLSGAYQAATSVDGGGQPGQALRFSSLATISLRLFANLGAQPALVERHPFLRGARLTVAVDNLFDARIDVRDGNGNVPLSYQPAYLDPLGRTIRVSFRKLFFTPPARR